MSQIGHSTWLLGSLSRLKEAGEGGQALVGLGQGGGLEEREIGSFTGRIGGGLEKAERGRRFTHYMSLLTAAYKDIN